MATRRKPGKPNVGNMDHRVHDGSIAELGRLVFLSDQTDVLDPLASYLQNQGALISWLTTQELGPTRYLVHKAHDGLVTRVELEETAVANSAREVLVFDYDRARNLESLVRGNGT